MEVHEDDVDGVDRDASASAAYAAWTTTSMPARDASSPTIPSRNTGWSSTTATRIGSGTRDDPDRQQGLDLVPRPGSERTSTRPPCSSARSRIALLPTPGRAVGSMPRPSSCTATRSPSGPVEVETVQRPGAGVPGDVDHGLGRDAVGRRRDLRPEGVVVVQVEAHLEPVLRVLGRELGERRGRARARRAPAAAGCATGCGRRRRAGRARPAAWPAAAAAAAGSVARRFRAPWRPSRSPASDGPRPSWISRRMTRRSSSRARASRSRVASTSSAARVTATAVATTVARSVRVCVAARTEGLATGQCHDEVADVLTAVAERDLDRMAVRHPPRDRVAPGHVHRHGLQAHGRADVPGEPAQQVVGGLREPEVAPQGAHDVVG